MKKLGEIAEFRNENIKYNVKSELIYISTANMNPEKSGIDLTDNESVGKSGKKFYSGDVLVSNIRPYFKKIWYANKDGICSPDVLIFKPITELSCNKRYLYYLLSNDQFFNYMTSTAKGTKMPRGDKGAIKEFIIPDHKDSQQLEIAGILSSLDNKIDSNNAIILNLEEQAQTIFKRWFVDFEPFQSESFTGSDSESKSIPVGWKMTNLESIATYKNGLAMQKYRPESNQKSIPVLKIKELRANKTDVSSDRCSIDIPKDVLIKDGDVIFSWSASLLVGLWTGGTVGLNQHLFKVTSNKFNKWFYYYWTKHFLDHFVTIAKDRATTMGHIKRSHLKDANVLIPDDATLAEMDNVMNPIVSKIINLGVQNKKLEEIRETLLPKLMSGEIRVEELVAKE